MSKIYSALRTATFLTSLLLLMSKPFAQETDSSAALQKGLAEGASATQLLQILADRGMSIADATVFAIKTAPQEMAGELTDAALMQVAPDEQEIIAYLALGASSGIGVCKVAETLGMSPPTACSENTT